MRSGCVSVRYRTVVKVALCTSKQTQVLLNSVYARNLGLREDGPNRFDRRDQRPLSQALLDIVQPITRDPPSVLERCFGRCFYSRVRTCGLRGFLSDPLCLPITSAESRSTFRVLPERDEREQAPCLPRHADVGWNPQFPQFTICKSLILKR